MSAFCFRFLPASCLIVWWMPKLDPLASDDGVLARELPGPNGLPPRGLSLPCIPAGLLRAPNCPIGPNGLFLRWAMMTKLMLPRKPVCYNFNCWRFWILGASLLNTAWCVVLYAIIVWKESSTNLKTRLITDSYSWRTFTKQMHCIFYKFEKNEAWLQQSSIIIQLKYLCLQNMIV